MYAIFLSIDCFLSYYRLHVPSHRFDRRQVKVVPMTINGAMAINGAVAINGAIRTIVNQKLILGAMAINGAVAINGAIRTPVNQKFIL